MRYLTIIFFLFCVHLSLSFYNATGLFGTYVQADNSFLNAVSREEMQDDSFAQPNLETEVNYDFGDYVKALFYFVGMFALGLAVVPYTLTKLGLPLMYAFLLSLPVYFLYAVAWIQIISKDNYKSKR